MKSLKSFDGVNPRPEIIRLKRVFGAAYGMIAGFAFAVASWGWNGYMLSKAHGYYPWTAFLVGAIACVLTGGLIGWLSAYFGNSLLSVIFWGISSLLFAWLIVALPLQIAPYIVSKLNPQLGSLMVYSAESAQIPSRFSVTLMWVVMFQLIVGAVQQPVTESAVFSASFLGKAAPFFLTIVVMSISGSVTDMLVNIYFREALESLDHTIQFVVENKGNENIDIALSRQLHAKALSPVEEVVSQSRYLYVGRYDNTLEDLQILVKFEEQWVDCHVQFNQPIFCKLAIEK